MADTTVIEPKALAGCHIEGFGVVGHGRTVPSGCPARGTLRIGLTTTAGQFGNHSMLSYRHQRWLKACGSTRPKHYVLGTGRPCSETRSGGPAIVAPMRGQTPVRGRPFLGGDGPPLRGAGCFYPIPTSAGDCSLQEGNLRECRERESPVRSDRLTPLGRYLSQSRVEVPKQGGSCDRSWFSYWATIVLFTWGLLLVARNKTGGVHTAGIVFRDGATTGCLSAGGLSVVWQLRVSVPPDQSVAKVWTTYGSRIPPGAERISIVTYRRNGGRDFWRRRHAVSGNFGRWWRLLLLGAFGCRCRTLVAMSVPATRYAKQSGVSIAYQVLGDGPIDVIWEPPWVSNIELYWEEPGAASFLNRLASFSRLVMFDRRNTGSSDRTPKPPSFEEQVDDLRAVMDEVGSTPCCACRSI